MTYIYFSEILILLLHIIQLYIWISFQLEQRTNYIHAHKQGENIIMTLYRVAWMWRIGILLCSSAIILQGCSVLMFNTGFRMERPTNSIAIPDTNVTYETYEYRSETYRIRAFPNYFRGWGFWGITFIPLFPIWFTDKHDKLTLNVEVLVHHDQNDTTGLKASVIVNSDKRPFNASCSLPNGELRNRKNYYYEFDIRPDTVETFTLQLVGATSLGAIPPFAFGKKTEVDYTPWYVPGLEYGRPQVDSTDVRE